jgi:quercetin dioxygenase-like cupin family protein
VAVSGGCNTPRTTPAEAPGCHVAAIDTLGVLPATPFYWHLDTYPTRAAAESGRGERGAIAEAHGRVWLFTIADAEWRPTGGQRIARVGPLPLTSGRAYVAHYIEGVVPPGARTPAHRHPGPEAWYVLEGTNCLQTPDEVRIARAGESLIIQEGPPMVLTGVGQTTRRSLALVVHDASQPWTIIAPGFTPQGSCPDSEQ